MRDTWEIRKNRISIDQTRWKKTFLPQLELLRRDLGLPEGCHLKAELHNLLVYAPGQFFIPHQDSEKKDGMIGTLVVSLPSRFTGGEMVIEHHEEKLSVGGSGDKLIFLALADVHETWECEDDHYGRGYGYRSRWSYDDEDDEEENGAGGMSSEPELRDLIDSDVELRRWMEESGPAQAISTGVTAGELCYTKPSVELKPFKSEYEGYMDNYGNTVDRLYHRAAVVLWPASARSSSAPRRSKKTTPSRRWSWRNACCRSGERSPVGRKKAVSSIQPCKSPRNSAVRRRLRGCSSPSDSCN